MAQSTDNVVTYGLRGMVGKMLVFRKRGDLTIVASRPKVDKNRVATTVQLAIQEKFKLASIYASGAIQDPILKAAYEASATGNQSGFNRAFKDAQLAPEFVGTPDVGNYTGVKGQGISAKVIDDFRVEMVKVKIVSPADVVIEQGNAVKGSDNVKWTYLIQQTNADVSGCVITFMAYDLPGNETIAEVNL
jgi:hypothetical protein